MYRQIVIIMIIIVIIVIIVIIMIKIIENFSDIRLLGTVKTYFVPFGN